MIAQDEAHVTYYVRQGDFWSIKDYREMSAALELPSIGATMTLAEIYRGVIFET